MELSTARINLAKTQTLKTWSATLDIVKSFVYSFRCIIYFEMMYGVGLPGGGGGILQFFFQ